MRRHGASRIRDHLAALVGHPIPFTNWSYPLYTLPLFWPLAQLPYFWALAVWTVGLFSVFAALVLSQIESSQRLAALLVLVLAPACLINTVAGQCGVLGATLMIGGILSIDRRPVVAGLLFGLLAFKPQMAVVIPFALLALGAWRVMLVATVTVLALLAMSIAMFGLDAWRHYFEVNAGYLVAAQQEFQASFKIMMASVFAAGRTFGLSYAAGLALQGAVAMITIAVACWTVRRTDDPRQRAFVLVTAAPLVTPYAFNYDLVGMAAVLVWMLFGQLRLRSEWSGVCFLAWIAPIAMMYLNSMGLGVMPLALMGLFVMSVVTTVQTPWQPLAAARNRPLPHPVAF